MPQKRVEVIPKGSWTFLVLLFLLLGHLVAHGVCDSIRGATFEALFFQKSRSRGIEIFIAT